VSVFQEHYSNLVFPTVGIIKQDQWNVPWLVYLKNGTFVGAGMTFSLRTKLGI